MAPRTGGHAGDPRSAARMAGHPLHPMAIPFPIAFAVSISACDILGAALVLAALAAVAGPIDARGARRIRGLSAVGRLMVGNRVAVLPSPWTWYRRDGTGDAAALPAGLLIARVVAPVLPCAGWRGWERVHRHRVAVPDEAA